MVMKKLILLLSILCVNMFPVSSGTHEVNVGESKMVYICTGPNAKVYHRTPNCKGLNKCSGSIKKVSVSDVSRSRRPCKICKP